jgi:predicted PurR-regulated permease PerM
LRVRKSLKLEYLKALLVIVGVIAGGLVGGIIGEVLAEVIVNNLIRHCRIFAEQSNRKLQERMINKTADDCPLCDNSYTISY